jgi:hypothetical protein
VRVERVPRYLLAAVLARDRLEDVVVVVRGLDLRRRWKRRGLRRGGDGDGERAAARGVGLAFWHPAIRRGAYE